MNNTRNPFRVYAFTFSLLTSCCCVFSCSKKEFIDVPQPAGARAVAPIAISYFSAGDTRASVTFIIDGIPVDVLFDTGSSGLRVLAGALKGAPLDTDKQWVRNTYSGGVGLYGKVAGAHISIGGLQSAGTVRIMRVDSSRENVNARYYPTGDSAHINNALFQVFNGIVGVGMRDTDVSGGVSSPLPQLPGAGSFIVEFPHYNGSQGELILNPSVTDLKGFNYIHLQPDFALLPNGMNSWQDNQLKDTLSVNGVPYTSNVLLDTGNPVSYYYDGPNSDTVEVKPGSTVKFSLGQPPAGETTFVVSEQPRSGLDLVETSNYAVRNVFGIQFFFAFDVFYDQEHGVIGIRKKQ